MTKYLDAALKAAKESEKIIMDYFSDKMRVKIKKDLTPVTQADIGAEKAIIETIRKAFPDHAFLGEESGASKTQNDFVWIIDPIDGTKNYVRCLPFFGTQIALMRNGEFIVGVSNAPAMKELMYAEKGRGTFLNGKPVSVSKVNSLKDAYFSYGGLGYFSKQQINCLFQLSTKTMSNRGFGDFWSYHLVAKGRIDAMLETCMKIWDVAALKVIVEEAGGRMTELNGRELSVSSPTCLATNGLLHNAFVQNFKIK